jgi:hypothetical protein
MTPKVHLSSSAARRKPACLDRNAEQQFDDIHCIEADEA